MSTSDDGNLKSQALNPKHDAGCWKARLTMSRGCEMAERQARREGRMARVRRREGQGTLVEGELE
jgi:hypothetical protein